MGRSEAQSWPPEINTLVETTQSGPRFTSCLAPVFSARTVAATRREWQRGNVVRVGGSRTVEERQPRGAGLPRRSERLPRRPRAL